MFKNEKKGRLYGIKKDTTFVDNPPIEDNTTKVTSKINFSKSNFLNLGKWILIIVLFLYFGSYTINGFIASNITKNSTEETIVHEYKKIIGYEQPNGYFDNLSSFDDISSLYGQRIYFYSYDEIINKNINWDYYESNKGGHIKLKGGFRSFTSLNGYSSTTSIEICYNQGNFIYMPYIQTYSPAFWLYGYGYLTDSYYESSRYDHYSFIINSFSSFSYTFEFFKRFLNDFCYFDIEMEEIPIYEITTYEYSIKDINYNWDYKLKQISKFRPLFNTKDLFVNEEFYKYSNLITYEFKNTEKEKENVVNKYKDDERLKILFDNESITIKGREYNFHLIKDKKDYISYINFDYSKIDMLNVDVYNAYMYALENYVNNNNIDDYFIYSKMNFDAKDLLILMSFPIQIVINTFYNFGVLVGIVTLW